MKRLSAWTVEQAGSGPATLDETKESRGVNGGRNKRWLGALKQIHPTEGEPSNAKGVKKNVSAIIRFHKISFV